MALASFPLKRVQEAPPQTYLKEITPKNWRRYPGKVITKDMLARAYEPPATVWYGGDYGDDQDEASATSNTNYGPRNQEAKATIMGTIVAKDVGRARGRIAPWQPYPTASTPPVPDPVLTSSTPATAAANSGKLIAEIVGTGFSPWTQLRSGGREVVFKGEYISPTRMQMLVDTSLAPAGTYKIQAVDHNTESNLIDFVLT